jgi:hypothetical protein
VKAMLPTQSEAPFVVAQLVVMALFVVLGIFAVKRFHAEPVRGGVAFGLARNSDIRDPPLGIFVPRNALVSTNGSLPASRLFPGFIRTTSNWITSEPADGTGVIA